MKRIITKLQKNASIYLHELQHNGLSSLITQRMRKFDLTWNLYTRLHPDTIEVNGYKIALDKTDRVITYMLLSQKKWSKMETKIVKKIVKKGDCVIDIGAHFGYFSLLFASLTGKTGHVYSFEPYSKSFTLLEKSIALNNFSQITPIQKAIFSTSSKKTLHVSGVNTGSNTIFTQHEKTYIGSQKVETITVDEFVLQQNIKKVNFVKIDIQGGEMDALLGMKKTINNNPNLSMIIEYEPKSLLLAKHSPKELIKLLSSHGFFLYELDEITQRIMPTNLSELEEKYPEDKDDGTNLLCLRKKIPTRSLL